MLIAKVLHVIGNILWLGGGATAALVMLRMAREPRETQVKVAAAVRTVALQCVTPGMLLSFAGGLYMLLTQWSSFYAKQPWMHAKLTVGLVAAAFSGVLSGKLRRAASGEGEIQGGAMGAAAAVLILSAVAGVLLVFLRFGAR